MKSTKKFNPSMFLIALIVALHTPHMTGNQAIITYAQENNIIDRSAPIKLHLGCGEIHLDGYINIDFPPSQHTVQHSSGADVFFDINQLQFDDCSIDEIRSHHFFEHFDRQTALSLLCKWHSWLKLGGKIVIETPDFEECVKTFLKKDTPYSQKQGIIRHIFGSHEAYWALHYDGWYKEKFENVLAQLHFESITSELVQYLYINNITIQAIKKTHVPLNILGLKAKLILRDSMIISVESEELMWQTWCKLLDEALSTNPAYQELRIAS